MRLYLTLVLLFWFRQVRACLFDFSAIAEALTAQAAAGGLGHSGDRAVMALGGGSGPSLLTTEACRLRWAELDAEQVRWPAWKCCL